MSLQSFYNSFQAQDSKGAKICNQDIGGTVKYYGIMWANSAYEIMKEDLTDEANPSYGYYYGAGDFAAKYADRANLTYTYPDGSTI